MKTFIVDIQGSLIEFMILIGHERLMTVSHLKADVPFRG